MCERLMPELRWRRGCKLECVARPVSEGERHAADAQTCNNTSAWSCMHGTQHSFAQSLLEVEKIRAGCRHDCRGLR
jgi:hypothetical protein